MQIARLDDINAKYKHDQTLLHDAMHWNKPQFAQLLLSACGADETLRNAHG